MIADDPLERQNDPPTDIGPEDEMREKILRERAEHEAVLRSLGIPIAGQEEDQQQPPPAAEEEGGDDLADLEDISDLNDYDDL